MELGDLQHGDGWEWARKSARALTHTHTDMDTLARMHACMHAHKTHTHKRKYTQALGVRRTHGWFDPPLLTWPTGSQRGRTPGQPPEPWARAASTPAGCDGRSSPEPAHSHLHTTPVRTQIQRLHCMPLGGGEEQVWAAPAGNRTSGSRTHGRGRCQCLCTV